MIGLESDKIGIIVHVKNLKHLFEDFERRLLTKFCALIPGKRNFAKHRPPTISNKIITLDKNNNKNNLGY